jgi:hypothetical protein
VTSHPTKPDVGAVLADLAARGVELGKDGARLRYRPAAAVSPSLAAGLAGCRAEILGLVTPGYSAAELAILVRAGLAPRDVPLVDVLKVALADLGMPVVVGVEAEPSEITIDKLSPDQREEFEERAAIMEFDGCMPRERAERIASCPLTQGRGTIALVESEGEREECQR